VHFGTDPRDCERRHGLWFRTVVAFPRWSLRSRLAYPNFRHRGHRPNPSYLKTSVIGGRTWAFCRQYNLIGRALGAFALTRIVKTCNRVENTKGFREALRPRWEALSTRCNLVCYTPSRPGRKSLWSSRKSPEISCGSDFLTIQGFYPSAPENAGARS